MVSRVARSDYANEKFNNRKPFTTNSLDQKKVLLFNSIGKQGLCMQRVALWRVLGMRNHYEESCKLTNISEFLTPTIPHGVN